MVLLLPVTKQRGVNERGLWGNRNLQDSFEVDDDLHDLELKRPLFLWYILGVAPLPSNSDHQIIASLSGDPELNFICHCYWEGNCFNQLSHSDWEMSSYKINRSVYRFPFISLVWSQVKLFDQQKHHQAGKIFVSSVSPPPQMFNLLDKMDAITPWQSTWIYTAVHGRHGPRSYMNSEKIHQFHSMKSELVKVKTLISRRMKYIVPILPGIFGLRKNVYCTNISFK